MNESLITLQGWLGSDVSLRQAGDATVASFRLGCTPRRYRRRRTAGSTATRSGTPSTPGAPWPRTATAHCGGETRSWFSGRVNAETWTNKAGIEVTSFSIDASFVGHDLNRGRSEFTKTVVRPAAEPGPVAVEERPGAEDQSAA